MKKNYFLPPKADLIMKRDLAGAFVWSVEMDDFGGICGDGKYPLLSTVVRILKPYEGIAQHAHAETKPKVKVAERPAVSTSDSHIYTQAVSYPPCCNNFA